MSNPNLESLMRDVARAVQTDARRRDILPEVERRLAAMDRPRSPRRMVWRLSFAGMAACAAAAAAFFYLQPQPLSYSVASLAAADAHAQVGGLGDRLEGPSTGGLALKFSDGSEVTLPARAKAHVDALDTRGATVALEQGTVEVSVVHRDRTRWQVRAGRYQIHVTGTRFSAGWDPRRQSLTVTMHEGSVAVTGPGLREPMRVVTGQRLRANAGAAVPGSEDPMVALEDANTPEASLDEPVEAPAEPKVVVTMPPRAAPVAVEAPVVREIRPVVVRTRRAPTPVPHAVARAESDWRTLESRAQYRDALAAALREGFSADCNRLGVEDVLKLGDIARLAGDLPHAEEAYHAARKRFPNADRPLYSLGLVMFKRHDNAGAARLFDAYLRYFPRGPLAREAAGLLIDARIKAGETGAAREAAENYLRNYPDGPHAGQARGLVRIP